MSVVGIYPGSFNPIHIGHLIVANYMCEFEGLDEVWFLVTPQNPLKDNPAEYSADQRFRWVRSAIEKYPKFKVSDFEWQLPYPHYTVQTLQSLRAIYPEKTFSLIIGADNWFVFNQWKDYKTILNEFDVLVYPRNGYDCTINEDLPRVRISQAPLVDISSTFIRENIQMGKDLRFFLPPEVADFLC